LEKTTHDIDLEARRIRDLDHTRNQQHAVSDEMEAELAIGSNAERRSRVKGSMEKAKAGMIALLNLPPNIFDEGCVGFARNLQTDGGLGWVGEY
jgi:hypothetical protein